MRVTDLAHATGMTVTAISHAVRSPGPNRSCESQRRVRFRVAIEPDHQMTVRRACLRSDPALTQLGAEVDQMQHRTPQPIQACDDQGVTAPQPGQHRIKLRARGFRTARMVEGHIVGIDTGAHQRINLVRRILIGSRDPRVTETTSVENTLIPGFSTEQVRSSGRHGSASAGATKVSPISVHVPRQSVRDPASTPRKGTPQRDARSSA